MKQAFNVKNKAKGMKPTAIIVSEAVYAALLKSDEFVKKEQANASVAFDGYVGRVAGLEVVVSPDGNISKVYISDAGIGYTSQPTIAVQNPPLITGIGTYTFNEIVIGQTSKTKARVKTWNKDNYILKVGITTGSFVPGEVIVGTSSSAIYSLKASSTGVLIDNYEQNDEFESEAIKIVDFSESNPFGNY
jgi:hypothetical protein